jgi:hypothetical protein
MNSFLELHSSSDYIVSNRPYYTGVWEYPIIATNSTPPWLVNSDSSNLIKVEIIDQEGSSYDLTQLMDGTELVTGLTKVGSGTWNHIDEVITTGTVAAGGYMYSNTFTLTAGVTYIAKCDPASYSDASSFTFSLYRDAAEQWSETVSDMTGYRVFRVGTTDTDYTLRITNDGAGTENCTDTNVLEISESILEKSGDNFWYGGDTLGYAWSGLQKLQVTVGTDVFTSDWLDACGYDGKLKFKVSSSYDFGGMPYSEGFEQWIYKDANVRRAPRSEIEITSETRNGVRIDEKIVTAVRYVVKMKCTESEWEAFVHAMGGTIEITDPTGKVYNCTATEITDPTWYRSNGVFEFSFIDTNNINVFTQV